MLALHLVILIQHFYGSIDYKNLSQAREHIEKYIFSQAQQPNSSALAKESYTDEHGKKVLGSDRSPITA